MFEKISTKLRSTSIIVSLLLIGLAFVAEAQPPQVGRYLTVTSMPTHAESHLLEQMFQVHFPASVSTVGDALNYLLQFSGYRLQKNKLACDVKPLMHAPLPEVDRDFGPMRLRDGLTTLAGAPYELEVNPVLRVVSFKLKRAYQHFYNHSKYC